jgi:hypothetical protein
MRYTTTFFHLPKIQSLTITGMHDGCIHDIDYTRVVGAEDHVSLSVVAENCTLPLPIETSMVQDIFPENTSYLETLFPDFLYACRALRKLRLHLAPALDEYELPDFEELSQVLKKNAESLKELDMGISNSWIDPPLHKIAFCNTPLSTGTLLCWLLAVGCALVRYRD